MATIIPFKGFLPAKDKARLVPSRAMDQYSPEELQTELANNPYSFLHIINPDFGDKHKTKAGSDERLLKTKAKFHQFVKEEILIRDSQAAYYIYQQIKDGNTYTGIIGCTSIDDYFNGTIKVHEQTLTARQEKLKHYLDVCEFDAEPVLFSYPDDEGIDEIIQKSIASTSDLDFITEDGVNHKLWIVDDEKRISQVSECFSKIKHIYIADGHHRSASSMIIFAVSSFLAGKKKKRPKLYRKRAL